MDIWNGDVSVRRVPVIRKPSRLQWLIDRSALPRALKQAGLQVFHATELTSIPVCNGTKVVAHVYDMIPFLFWNDYARRVPIDFRFALQLARKRIQQAASIVTISERSKNDIVELTGYPEERIYVAYPGGPKIEPSPGASSFEAAPHRACASRRQPLPEGGAPYFLYVGGTDFRKNVRFLIRGFARFTERERDVRLTLVGETFTKSSLPEVAEVLGEISRLGIANRVEMIGYVDDRRLEELYRHSVALVFPSLYEGFGLTVLEAMTYGTPVVAARTSSIPEVLGDTGIYFDPRDEDSLIAGLETVYRHPARCSELVEKAKQRAQMFSWKTVADVVFEIYERI
jgi:glycosyltransferase involved in cell wall biosynthesis